ncbi:hypothetical protein CDAR_206591 [Caerostris darwini]|uniref:Uncharacterized protein n=1 Tax=Caerostris darwini TaxID=1538125 RepID=A0AAV4S8H8_9ARAC|nr:hypothetical protein CDAR_206591 [Caerostris darwini]
MLPSETGHPTLEWQCHLQHEGWSHLKGVDTECIRCGPHSKVCLWKGEHRYIRIQGGQASHCWLLGGSTLQSGHIENAAKKREKGNPFLIGCKGRTQWSRSEQKNFRFDQGD